jgi:hypothetical protein
MGVNGCSSFDQAAGDRIDKRVDKAECFGSDRQVRMKFQKELARLLAVLSNVPFRTSSHISVLERWTSGELTTQQRHLETLTG